MENNDSELERAKRRIRVLEETVSELLNHLHWHSRSGIETARLNRIEARLKGGI